jgi:hypothetical protein
MDTGLLEQSLRFFIQSTPGGARDAWGRRHSWGRQYYPVALPAALQRGDAYARRGFRFRAGQRCGDHDVRRYVAQVNLLKRRCDAPSTTLNWSFRNSFLSS